MANQLSPLLHALAGLYAAENRQGGDLAARALLAAAGVKRDLPASGAAPLDAVLAQCLTDDPHPLS
ncbi:MAG: hypothetical protein GXP03_01000, partial [Alphaproteobacteria bacterium]|nr:hypothetical protein [Alphaproteobacteria bacterium]